MRAAAVFISLLAFAVVPLLAAEPMMIEATSAPVTIDGVLDEAAWQTATKYETWYETNPGDNIEPKLKTLGYMTFDSKFLYIAIESFDDPKNVRAVYGDHDQISGNTDDYVGIIVDTRNDGKTAYLFLVTARNVQYDAVTDDSGAGEDSSPDYFWDSEAKIHEKGWTAEMRIPFSSLRYDNPNPEQWGMVLYRNMPRDRRYQYFTSKLPRDSNCFVCNFGKITGLRNLPAGDHYVIAPYVTAHQLSEPRNGLGTEFVNHQVGTDGGLDVKWNPTSDMAIDGTINPDFSQVESDVAVISTNERFAIFIPEKRPFFLEGVELFSTPIQAVYTRTLTAPRWGGRATGKMGKYHYTMLVSQDRGGGLVIIPSAFGSGFAAQDFKSTAFIGRVRRDLKGRSFISFLTTARESEGGAHNRVFGPDFQWRIGDHHTVTGQLLYSDTATPNRPDLASEWNGQKLRGHAGYAWYAYSTATNDFYINYSDYDEEFRADNGFVPQVGYRGSFAEGGHTWRPTGFFNRFRLYAFGEYLRTQDGDPLFKMVSTGFGADGKYRSFTRIRLAQEEVANRGEVFDRTRLYYQFNIAVSRVISQVGVDGWFGDDVDFATNTPGRGTTLNGFATLRPTDHLQIGFNTGWRWLNIGPQRLFTSQFERIKATYTFNSRMFLRAIVQNQRNHRDDEPDDFRSGSLGSQLLFAYKLNWQTVFYVGYGDLREVVSEQSEHEPSNRQFFAKVSYAFQR